MSTKNERIRIYAWLGLLAVTCVAADGGDDFSNNLFSDLSPLLALFGERVTMQFMSQSMGWADNIILAMAPLGILTIVVSAIRVGGPSWLKAVIGRAWENLSAAEVELMSSTSEEVCELWNGRGLVRCMGSAPIVEFICLLPKKDRPDAEASLTGHWYSSTKLKSFLKLSEKPPMKTQNSSTKAEIFYIETMGLEKALHVIGETCKGYCENCKGHCKPCPECCKACAEDKNKCTGCCKVCAGVCNTCERNYKSCTEICKTCTRDCNSGANGQVKLDLESGNASSSAQIQQASSKTDNNSLQKFSITRNSDHGSPNVSLNIHGPSSKFELVLAAICGTILQLGVLVYGWFATYYASLKFPKDDEPVASYAYPCTAAGTLLLVCGIAVCGHVVDSSTKEREFKAKDERELRVIWLQQQKTVSDQLFKSCAIYAKKPQLSIKSSRRDNRTEHQDQEEVNWSQLGLGTKTILGTAVTLSGFVLQFVGLRGMHWSISIAQLGAVLVMVMLKAFVRRRLADPPSVQELVPEFELDWLARTLGNEGYASFWHWGGDRDKQNGSLHDWIILSDEETKLKDVEKRPDTPPPVTEDPSASRSTDDGSGGSEGTVQETTVSAPLVSSARHADSQDRGAGNAKSQHAQSCAQAILFARKELGSLSDWHGFAYDEAVCLSRAIEITMNTLFASTDEGVWEWRVTVQCDDSKDKPNVGLKLCRENDNWKVELNEIDAALSLWLFSIDAKSGRNIKTAESCAEKKTQDCHDTASQSPKNKAVDRPQLNVTSTVRGKRSLGVYTPQLEQDLAWWVPRDWLRTFELNEDDPELLKFDNPKNTSHHAQGENADSARIANRVELLAIDFQGSWKMLCAQSLFSLFMRAVAEKLEDPVEGGVEDLPPDSAIEKDTWKKLQLRNSTLLRMVQGVHQAGLGNLTEIYTSIVTPLSQKGKLPRMDKVIEWVRGNAEECARLEDWQRMEACLGWLPNIAVTPYTTARAEGIRMDHLRRAISVEEFRKEQGLPADESLMNLRGTLRGEDESMRGDGDLSRLFHFVVGGYQSLGLFSMRAAEFQKEYRRLTYSYRKDKNAMKFPKAFELTEWHYQSLRNNHREQYSPKGDVNAKDVLDRTAAHYCAVTGGVFIGILKEHHADLNVQDLLGWTPLHYACQAGADDVIAELVQAGVRLDHQARDGATPLHCAVSSGCLEGVRSLVGAGATVGVRDFQGNLPIHLAAYGGHDEIVRILLEDGSRNLQDRFGRTALHQAALVGEKKVIDVLLANDAFAKDLEARDRNGQTSLSLAARANHPDCIEALLKKGADVKSEDREGQTPLHWAAKSGHPDWIKALLDKGADINSQNHLKETPLYCAAELGHTKSVLILLDEQADANLPNHWGGIPLHAAAKSGKIEIAQMLFAKQSDVNLQARQSDDTPLMEAACYGQTAIIEFLAKNGADLQLKNKIGRTALHCAIARNSAEATETLIKWGANIEATEEDGLTPLMVAAKRGRLRIVEQLLASGADVNATDAKGRTALDVTWDEEIRSVLQSTRKPSCQILDRAPHVPPCAVAV